MGPHLPYILVFSFLLVFSRFIYFFVFWKFFGEFSADFGFSINIHFSIFCRVLAGGPTSAKISSGSNLQLRHSLWSADKVSLNFWNRRSVLAFALIKLIHLITEYSISFSLGATLSATKFSLWITQRTTNMLGLSSCRSKQVNQLYIYQPVWLWASAFSFCIPTKIGSWYLQPPRPTLRTTVLIYRIALSLLVCLHGCAMACSLKHLLSVKFS